MKCRRGEQCCLAAYTLALVSCHCCLYSSLCRCLDTTLLMDSFKRLPPPSASPPPFPKLWALMLNIALCSYEYILRTEKPAPAPDEITLGVAWVGLISNVLYFLAFCLPQRRSLLQGHEIPGGATAGQAVGMILLFAIVYNCHSTAQVINSATSSHSKLQGSLLGY